ncbi:hypothetical protein L1987_14230 [Smallanthus sonchifolius]|uniref:Uncharacterized protein n=1 Tax=Smallanthus sonchifolius TaxID=185202 RepID=A0ACB9J2S8_9ASTR|nr:hypothetical protein L1987_14230 [Smallanthus sonchifolius]
MEDSILLVIAHIHRDILQIAMIMLIRRGNDSGNSRIGGNNRIRAAEQLHFLEENGRLMDELESLNLEREEEAPEPGTKMGVLVPPSVLQGVKQLRPGVYDFSWRLMFGEEGLRELDEQEEELEEEQVPSWEDEYGYELVDLPTPSEGSFDPLGDLKLLEDLLYQEPSVGMKEEVQVQEVINEPQIELVSDPPHCTREREARARGGSKWWIATQISTTTEQSTETHGPTFFEGPGTVTQGP